jgi:hypothetical protein
VYVNVGSFIMNNGVISGNTTGGGQAIGGGVRVAGGGTFTKSGTSGIIYGSNAPEGQANKANGDDYGHSVYVQGGKKRNSTARATTLMDSTKSGASGGWE